MGLVEEINRKTYNPTIYYTSINAARTFPHHSRVFKSASSSGSNRSNKRINYSLANLKNRLYNQNKTGTSESSDDETKQNDSSFDSYSQLRLFKSNKRFMELNTENPQDLCDVPHLVSILTGICSDRVDLPNTATKPGAMSGRVSVNRARNKLELPKNIQLMFRCTRPPIPKRKNTNRIIALKKTLSSRRPLSSYLDALDDLNRNIIYSNVYNKKFTKVLPVITVCSICGGYKSISSCVRCADKICSLRCFNLHNETRCSQ